MNKKLKLVIQADFDLKDMRDMKNAAEAIECAMEDLLGFGNAEITYLDVVDGENDKRSKK